MMPQPLDPVCLFGSLRDHGVDYVLIGGMAAVLHGSPTVTNDADIVPDPHPDNLTRLSAALVDLAARIRTVDDPEGIPFDPHPALMASMAILDLTTRYGNLDLAFSPAGIEDYGALSERSVRFDLDDTAVTVASLDDVIRSKEAADRPRDRAALPCCMPCGRRSSGSTDPPSPSWLACGPVSCEQRRLTSDARVRPGRCEEDGVTRRRKTTS